MFLDLLHALVTPAPRAHRRLGCVGDSIRTGSRSLRCRRAWAPHLEATKAAIREAVSRTTDRDTAVVLGSGRLDDVPLDDLANAFRRVVLVDAVHPLATRRQTRRYVNVERVTVDLSGSFGLILGQAQDLRDPLPAVCRELGTTLVISANLLSQLPIRPVERLEASRRGFGEWRPEDGDRFGRAIIDRHCEALAALPAQVCLVTDLHEVEEDRSGNVLDRIDLLYGCALGTPDATWAWELAPFGEIGRDRRLIHSVAAFPDWRPEPRPALHFGREARRHRPRPENGESREIPTA